MVRLRVGERECKIVRQRLKLVKHGWKRVRWWKWVKKGARVCENWCERVKEWVRAGEKKLERVRAGESIRARVRGVIGESVIGDIAGEIGWNSQVNRVNTSEWDGERWFKSLLELVSEGENGWAGERGCARVRVNEIEWEWIRAHERKWTWLYWYSSVI